MAQVRFEVHHDFSAPARAVWDELVDWERHGEWIPATRMDVPPGGATEPGQEFTAYTGLGPLALKDHMRVVRCDWDDSTSSGDCEVEKLGPVLRGSAGFTVSPTPGGSSIVWIEDVTVPYTPQFAAPIVAKLGALGFRIGMGKLDALVSASD